MSEIGDTFAALKEIQTAKKKSNATSSIALLINRGIKFDTLSTGNWHLRLGDYDFWPSTGKFINRKSKRTGRGVRNLIRLVLDNQKEG